MSEPTVDVLACRNCGGRARSWAPSYVVKSGVPDGRLRVHDVSCVFVLGCDECSETLRVVDAGAYSAAVAELIAYAECEEAKRLSVLPTSKGGTGDGQSYLATFHRHGFDGRDVYGFLDKLRRAALARVGAAP